ARDTRLNRKVALKVLSRERMNNPRALARFQREAKVGAQLQHENLVRIYDEGEANGHHFLVMEYIEGKTVGQLIQEHGPLRPALAARIGRQVALGLAHAHQKGLIHRDVNPMNILVDAEGTAKLTDLGLAIDLGDQGDHVTRDGATIGTFDYISPEQARYSRGVDTRSDLYSLGCTLYHMIAGRVPFPQPSLPEKLYAHQALMPDRLDELMPDVPEGLARVVERLMAKSPADRYPHPLAAAMALEPYASGPVGLAEIEAIPMRSSAQVPAGQGPTAANGAVPSPPKVGSDTELAQPAVTATSTPTPKSPRGSDSLILIPNLDLGPELPLSATLSTSERRALGTDPRLRLWIGVGLALVLALVVLLGLRGPG
ncbi:MAG: protein kinase, partial [Isosphaeraceae bacterium]|nr:protein kinase [Isosphaeraceae bacterium]